MSYLENMSLHELAMQYKNYSDESALEELENRDRLSKMTYDERMALRLNEEPDNQMLFEFAQSEGNNSSVKVMDEWHEAYEAGFAAGRNVGKSPDKKFVGYVENQAEQFAIIGEAIGKKK